VVTAGHDPLMCSGGGVLFTEPDGTLPELARYEPLPQEVAAVRRLQDLGIPTNPVTSKTVARRVFLKRCGFSSGTLENAGHRALRELMKVPAGPETEEL